MKTVVQSGKEVIVIGQGQVISYYNVSVSTVSLSTNTPVLSLLNSHHKPMFGIRPNDHFAARGKSMKTWSEPMMAVGMTYER